MWETLVRFLGQEGTLEKGLATHSGIHGLPCGSDGKESTCSVGDLGSTPGWEDPLEEDSWPGESPRTKEPGGLQPMGSQRVGHD